MIKEIETTKLLTSVEKDGKVAELFFEHELPSLLSLYAEYGKENVHTMAIKTKTRINVVSDKDFRRRLDYHLSVSKNRTGNG